MISKLIIGFLLLFAVAFTYTEENGVLVLNNEDLVNIRQLFPHIFIDYYVPWCKHCQKLTPIMFEIASTLKSSNSPIRIATIDCNENEDAYDFAQLNAFPTLIYYQDGQPTHFDGDRTKPFILKWLNKRIQSPVKEIVKTELQILKKSQQNKVSIVFVGSLKSIKGAKFINIAYQDNYNEYYFIEQEVESYGTVLLLRSFAEDVHHPASTTDDDDQNLYKWIIQYDRPTVVPLDDRSISAVFRDGKSGLFFFIDERHRNMTSIFDQAAKEWKNQKQANDLIFIAVTEEHDDYFGLLEYLEMNPLELPIVIINEELNTKHLLKVKIQQLTTQKIFSFIQDYQNGKIEAQILNSHQHNHDHDHDHDHHHHDHDHHHHHHHDHDHDHHHHHDHDHHHHEHDHDHDHDHHDHHPHQHEHDHDHHGDDCPHHSHHSQKSSNKPSSRSKDQSSFKQNQGQKNEL